MKLTPRPNRSSGHLILVFVLFVAIVAILWIGSKIIDRLQRHPPDPWHGQDTNDITQLDPIFTPIMASLREQLPSNPVVSVALTQIGTTVELPLEALAYQWHYRILTSTNMKDWSPTELNWGEDSAMMQTNHNEPARFYWRQLIY